MKKPAISKVAGQRPEMLLNSVFSNIFPTFDSMDSFWFYIFLAVVYLVTRALKKAGEPREVGTPPPGRARSEERTTGQPQRQMTFEELLREITEAKQPKQQSTPPRRYEEVEPQQTYVDYDDQIGEEEQSLEEVDYSPEQRVYREYEEGKRIAFQRPSLEETMALEAKTRQVEYGKFKEFEVEEERPVLERYLDIDDPEGWKKAVVMSEILNRRFQHW